MKRLYAAILALSLVVFCTPQAEVEFLPNSDPNGTWVCRPSGSSAGFDFEFVTEVLPMDSVVAYEDDCPMAVAARRANAA